MKQRYSELGAARLAGYVFAWFLGQSVATGGQSLGTTGQNYFSMTELIDITMGRPFTMAAVTITRSFGA